MVDQAGLHLDQLLLVAREVLQFLEQWGVGLQPAKISQVGSAQFRQQRGIDQIGLGPRGGTAAIKRPGVNGRDGKPGFQQGCDQQPPIGFHETGQILFLGRTRDAFQERKQGFQASLAVVDPLGGHLVAIGIDDDHIVMSITPIQPGIPHE